jgi:hypothetical protein
VTVIFVKLQGNPCLLNPSVHRIYIFLTDALCAACYQPLAKLLCEMGAELAPLPSHTETTFRPLAEKTEILLRPDSGIEPGVAAHLRNLVAMRRESLNVYLHQLDQIRGISNKAELWIRNEFFLLFGIDFLVN